MDRNSYARKVGSGRRRKTTAREDQMIVREVTNNRYCTSVELRRLLPGLNVSASTIRRRINERSEFRSEWQSKKPYVSEANRIRRVQWCRDHLNWTVEDWGKVLWSDESPFVLRFNRKRRVWRTAAEKYSYHQQWVTSLSWSNMQLQSKYRV